MKNNLMFSLILMLLIGCDNNVYSQVSTSNKPQPTRHTTKESSIMSNSEVRVRFTFNGKQAIAVLNDNPTTRSMLAQLPITLPFEDYSRTEKITYFPNKLSKQDAPAGHTASSGDITCYGPWGNLAIFYKSFPYSNGLIYMGKFESGFEELSRQGNKFDVTIELLE